MGSKELNITYRPIKELKPYKKNAKKHDKKQVEQIANSIKEFGFTQPVIIDKHECVVAGHGRILGAKKAGLKQVPTVCLDELTEEQIKAYRLADNKLNESEWDYGLIDEEIEQLTDIDMSLFGFDESVDLINAIEYVYDGHTLSNEEFRIDRTKQEGFRMIVEKCYKKIYKELIDECGQPITVRDYETWEDVRAYGTYQFGNEDDMLWTYDEKLYRLCFRELSREAQEIILDNKI